MKKKSLFYSLLIFSLVFLLNPSYNVFDIMPDFISWFILARLFDKAADSAPYFEEARSGFLKLGYVNLAKVLGLLAIIFVKGRDTSDNNIFALVSFSFAAVELLFLCPSVKNIFLALHHLGERTDAASLISPVGKKGRQISADAVKGFTFLFLITKTIVYTLPDFFLLTRTTDKGYFVNVSKAYLPVLLLSQALGLALGIAWFVRTRAYVDSVREEGKFSDAIESMRAEDKIGSYEIRTKIKSLNFLLALISIASVFTLEITFSNWSGINILPHFIYIGLMLTAVLLAQKHVAAEQSSSPLAKLACKPFCLITGASAFVASIVCYIQSVSFLSKYSYEEILVDKDALSAYKAVEIFAFIESLLTILFLFGFLLLMNRIVICNTGIPASSERYSRTEAAYHASLKNKNLIIFIIGAVASAVKCVHVFLNASTEIIFTDKNDVTAGAFSASVVPWFNLVVTSTAILYIILSFYYMSNLKDEIKMKYSDLIHDVDKEAHKPNGTKEKEDA